MHGDKVAIATGFAGSTSTESDTQYECLLEYQHEHCGNDKRAIAALGIEHRHIYEIERTRLYLLFAHGIFASHLALQLSTHVLGNSHSSLIQGLIGEHERHVAIHAECGLLHATDAGGKIAGDIIDALGQLARYERFGFVHIGSMAQNLDIG